MTSNESKTIGKLKVLLNPCTTEPCLPRLALAVVADDRAMYFLTRHGRFCMQNAGNLLSPGERVVLGERVVAVGNVHEQQDVNGKSFKTIELTRLTRAAEY